MSNFSAKFRGERDYDDEEYFLEESKNKKRQKQYRKQKHYDDYEYFETKQSYKPKSQKYKSY